MSALQHYEQELAGLSLDVAHALAPILERLRLATGPLPTSAQRDEGEPDGASGLGRRGHYERLLVSEWLLAEEAPDEFDRRAAGGEHLFVQLARSASSAGVRSVVLFDAGPEQLGGPRLVHLAALVVLARRAREAGAGFAWGVAQRPAEGRREDANVAALESLIAARTALPVSEALLDTWDGTLAPDDELWVVGGPRATRAAKALPRHVRVLELVDPLDPDHDVVRAYVWRPGRRTTETELPLPAPNVAARILRDPLAARHAATPTVSRPLDRPVDGLGWSADGRRLFARHAGGLYGWPVSVTPGAVIGARRRQLALPSGETAIAAGAIGRAHLALARAASGALRLYRNADVRTLSLGASGLGAPAPGATLGSILPMHDREILVWDPRGTVIEIPATSTVCTTTEDVVAIGQWGGSAIAAQLAWPRSGEELRFLQRVNGTWRSLLQPIPVRSSEPLEVFLGTLGAAGLCAVRNGGEQFHVFRLKGDEARGSRIRVPRDRRVLGLLHHEPAKLLTLTPDGRGVETWSVSHGEERARVPRDVVEARASTTGELVAVRYGDGAIDVFDVMRRGRLALSVGAEGARS